MCIRDSVSGQFPTDKTLPNDADLMDRFGVSRTVLREALKTLEAKGMVEARAKVGTRVLQRTRWNLFDRQVLSWIFDGMADPAFLQSLFDVRYTLELQAASRAATHRTSDHMRMLHYWLNQRNACALMPENCAMAEFEFHRTLCEASQNPLLRASSGLTEFAIAASFAPRIAAGVEDFAVGTAAAFTQVVAAMEAGEPSRVTSALRAILAADAANAGVAQQDHPKP
jgi:DNA-binding FadR family transcriptional regulator